jgi:hypothetical protein
MATLFQCPDCFETHEGPLEAAFHLALRCGDCTLDAGLHSWAEGLRAERAIARAA